MKKISDEELNQWRFDQKRAPVSVRITPGSEPFLYMFTGEVKNLLWSVKNALNLNKHMQGEGNRTLRDGTRIRVKCIFGLDIVEIDTRRSTLLGAGIGTESCTITFINIPLSAPPMKNLPSAMNQGTIYPTDVEGVDYFKTYYSFTLNNCPTCKEIEWNLTFNYGQPLEPRHFHNFSSIPQMGVPPGEDDPNNHMIYSLSFPCYAEIIDHGHDAGGYYIIWKAYTETPLLGEPYSRTGLGIMLINALILDSKGITVCSQQAKIDVDCCKKASDLRNVEIWWEDFGTCQPFIMYEGVLYNAICKMPTEVPIGGTAGLIWYGCMHPYQPLYAIPEIKGSCLPVEWTLSGPIELWGSEKNDNSIYFRCIEGGCNESATITLRDRCGTEYQIRGRPCCEDAGPLSINYTSLLMSCSQQQDFSALGGCGPYSWAITGGGGTLSDDTGPSTTYHAPATNTNCTDNPTIQVTDCCGNSAEVKLAINCYSESGIALGEVDFTVCACRHYLNCNICGWCYKGFANWHSRRWDCSGTLVFECESNPGCQIGSWSDCGAYEDGGADCWSQIPGNCQTVQCGCGCSESEGCPCNTLHDCRTTDMKTAGCCPLNPLTGEPY